MDEFTLTYLIIILTAYAVIKYHSKLLFVLKRHKTIGGLRLPFDGWWYTVVGGRVIMNHHIPVVAQQFAYDFVVPLDDYGLTYHNEGTQNEDYPCYGLPILAAHTGTVVLVHDGVPDNIVGEMNTDDVYGNTVMIQHTDGPVSVYAHLKPDSITVEQGATVQAGEQIGLCGNSGNSSEPHLHFHIQSEVGFDAGTGLRPQFSTVYTKLSLKDSATKERLDYTPKFPDFLSPN